MFSVQPENHTTDNIFSQKRRKNFFFVYKEINQIKDRKLYNENEVFEPLGKCCFAK